VIWLTWRQHRQQALAAAVVLAVIGGFLLITHAGIADLFRTSGAEQCLRVPGRDCSSAKDLFFAPYQGMQFLLPLFLVLPLFVGLFWGAPLVAREVEQGTHRLVWTQGITRARWIGWKLLLVGGATAAIAAALTILVTWWSEMFVRAGEGPMLPGTFDIRGVVPIAYAVFALALGVAAGSLIRKILPAMAATLGAFVAVRAVIDIAVRRRFMSPRTAVTSFFAQGRRLGFGDWVLSEATIDRTGAVVSPTGGLDYGYLASRCPGLPPPTSKGPLPELGPISECVHNLGLHLRVTYQPGTRYWAFQGIEAAIYLALAAALFGLAVWVVRRRIA